MDPITSIHTRVDKFAYWKLVDLVQKGRAKFDPDPCRITDPMGVDYSRIIERVLVGLPVRLVYATVGHEGVMTIHDNDGVINALNMFHMNLFELTGLQLAKELEGKRYSRLLPILQNRIDDCPIVIYMIHSVDLNDIRVKMLKEAL